MARWKTDGVVLAAVLWATLFGASSCAARGRGPVTLSLPGSRVSVSTIPREGCTALGEVHGWSNASGNMDAAVQWARNDIRNKAAELDANFVLLETQAGGSDPSVTWAPAPGGGAYAVWSSTRHSFTIYGTAFRCPEPTE